MVRRAGQTAPKTWSKRKLVVRTDGTLRDALDTAVEDSTTPQRYDAPVGIILISYALGAAKWGLRKPTGNVALLTTAYRFFSTDLR